MGGLMQEWRGGGGVAEVPASCKKTNDLQPLQLLTLQGGVAPLPPHPPTHPMAAVANGCWQSPLLVEDGRCGFLGHDNVSSSIKCSLISPTVVTFSPL